MVHLGIVDMLDSLTADPTGRVGVETILFIFQSKIAPFVFRPPYDLRECSFPQPEPSLNPAFIRRPYSNSVDELTF